MEIPVNMEETIGRTVGRRRIQEGLRYGMRLDEASNRIMETSGRGLDISSSSKAGAKEWQKALGHGVRIPKGVFRFNSHEEADEWLWKMITRKTD